MQKKLGQLMEKDELDCWRIATYRQRTDAYLERKPRENDENMNDGPNEPNSNIAKEPKPDDPDKHDPNPTDAHAPHEPQPDAHDSATPERPSLMSAEDGIDAEDTTFLYPWTAPDMETDLLTTDFENQIMDINEHDPDMKERLINLFHLSKLYSPPRVATIASEMGLHPGASYDLLTHDENCKPWDFDDVTQRQRCKQRISKEKPYLLIGSPMCTAFSSLQNLNRERMCAHKWNLLWNYGVKHLLFAIDVYDMQLSAGRYVLHEHPQSAASWHLPEMVALMQK